MSESSQPTLTQVFYPLEEMNFALILAITLIAVVLTILVQRVLPRIAEGVPGRFRYHLLPLIPVFRLIILVLAIVLIAPLIVRPTLQNFIALFGAAGLAVGFAFKDYISSLIAGVVTVYEQPYRLGDRISIEGVYGEVKSVGLRAVQLVTPDDTIVTIPHAKIWDKSIFNANAGKRDHLCVADFYLHPRHDARAVRQRLTDVILTSPYLQLNRPLTVVVSEKPWGTHYRLKAYPIDGRDEFQFISDLTVRGKEALAEMGVAETVVPMALGERSA